MSEQNSNNENSNDGHADHPKPRYDDVNIPVVVLVGIFSAILTFVSICFVQGLYYQWEHSVVQADWNSRILTPQEQAIVDQIKIRDGFYETKSGEIYISVDVAAEKMLSAQSTPASDDGTEKQKPNDDQPNDDQPKASKPEPPGPEDQGGSEPEKKAPAKQDPEQTQSKQTEPKKTDSVPKAEPKKAEPKKAEPKKAEPKKDEPKKENSPADKSAEPAETKKSDSQTDKK